MGILLRLLRRLLGRPENSRPVCLEKAGPSFAREIPQTRPGESEAPRPAPAAAHTEAAGDIILTTAATT